MLVTQCQQGVTALLMALVAILDPQHLMLPLSSLSVYLPLLLVSYFCFQYHSSLKMNLRAGAMSQSTKYLPHKHEAPILVPEPIYKARYRGGTLTHPVVVVLGSLRQLYSWAP